MKRTNTVFVIMLMFSALFAIPAAADINCTDTDGGIDYTVSGTCTDNTGTYEDSCSGSSGQAVRDWHCVDNGCVVSAVSRCDSWHPGTKCIQGACVSGRSDTVIETVEASIITNGINTPAISENIYQGNVILRLSGIGQSGGHLFSDAIYKYGDAQGNELPDIVSQDPFLLCLNRQPITSHIQDMPEYDPEHVYEVEVSFNEPTQLEFAVCDLYRTDNSGKYKIEVLYADQIDPADVSEDEQPSCKSIRYLPPEDMHRDKQERIDYCLNNRDLWAGLLSFEEGDYIWHGYCTSDLHYVDEHYVAFDLRQCSVSTCTDTDGGKDMYAKGTVKGWIDDGDLASRTDACGGAQGDTLAEYFCEGRTIVSARIECPHGCENGACRTGGGPVCGNNECETEWERVHCPEDCKEGCVQEGQYTSGPVSPQYQTSCCAGLEEFYPYQDIVGGGGLCYDPDDGSPVCDGQGTRSEGWYYSGTGQLIRYADCDNSGITDSCGDSVCEGSELGSCEDDCDVPAEYLLLRDIGDYSFERAGYQDSGEYAGVRTYEAIYRSAYQKAQVIVAEFLSSETAGKAFQRDITSIGHDTIRVQGHDIYLIEGGNTAAWRHKNLVILVQGSRKLYPAETVVGRQITGRAIVGRAMESEAILTETRYKLTPGADVDADVEVAEDIKPVPGYRIPAKDVALAYIERYPPIFGDYRPICGNHVCEPGESPVSCPADCPSKVCETFEVDPEARERCIQKRGKWVQGEVINGCPVPPYCVGTGDDLDELEKLAIIMKMEKLKIRIEEMETTALGLAEYYKSQDDTENYERWSEASGSFAELVEYLEDREQKIRYLEGQELKEHVRETVRHTKDRLRRIISLLLSAAIEEPLPLEPFPEPVEPSVEVPEPAEEVNTSL
ncbi:hypothetical protein GF351_04480 [Candidatus Woesearchaeota archaeon]|nr:hypothetical protein [Candidatus Woesearchaeota archaeon]